MPETRIEVQQLKQYFPTRAGGKKATVKAVDDISFTIAKGETLGLVGESGCGKTTTGRSILRLYQPTAGSILYDGADITHAKMLPYRRKMQIVFQDPYSSLDPRMTVSDIVGEALDIHHLAENTKDRQDKILSLLETVGLSAQHAQRYPHEFSGGQRQRVGIARALAVEPEFLVCDEPISALDVSIQAQIINMFADLQTQRGLTYLFIAHDLAVVRHISQRIAVMYLGKIVEIGPSDTVAFHSAHPYTRSLLSAIPIPDPRTARAARRIVLAGDVPSPLHPPSGCRFRTRCPYADALCAQADPPLTQLSPGHFAACHHLERIL